MATDKSAVPARPKGDGTAADKKERVRPQAAARPTGGSNSPGVVQKATKYLQEVRTELKKTTWPSKQDLVVQTQVVVALLIVVGCFIASWDFILGQLFRLLFSIMGVKTG